MHVLARLAEGRDALSPAERRVAEVVVDDPTLVAFGTVARLAGAAGASPPSVVRLAHRLGYRGFRELQAAVQADLAGRLSPAAERIRARPAAAPLATTLALDLENVHATLSAVDEDVFKVAVRALVRSRQVLVTAADELRGVAATVALQLGALRSGVSLAPASGVGLGRAVADLDRRACLVALDLERYERVVADAGGLARGRGATVVALTDSPLSPLAGGAACAFTVAAAGPGPFDSHVGFLALGNALVAGAAASLRATAGSRLSAAEAAWAQLGLFTS
jgi:DNA-binding MurR/RpiR family transcriptional regulator